MFITSFPHHFVPDHSRGTSQYASSVWPLQREKKKKKAEEIRDSALWGSTSPSPQQHGQMCHCQILLRAAECKQQMVELVPEQHVISNHPALGSALAASWASMDVYRIKPAQPSGLRCSLSYDCRGFVGRLWILSHMLPLTPVLSQPSLWHPIRRLQLSRAALIKEGHTCCLCGSDRLDNMDF